MIQTKTHTNEKEAKMTTSPKRLARIVGVLYLLVGICGRRPQHPLAGELEEGEHS